MWEQHVLIYSLGVVSVWRILIRNWHSRDGYLALQSLSKSISGGLLLNLRDRSNVSLVKWVVFETSDCLGIGYSSRCTSMNEAWDYGRVNGLTAPVKPLSSRAPSVLSPSWSILPSDKPQHWLILSSDHNSVYLRMSSSSTARHKGLGQEWKCPKLQNQAVWVLWCLSANKYLHILWNWFSICLLCNKPRVQPHL